jgi:hypothetical protein
MWATMHSCACVLFAAALAGAAASVETQAAAPASGYAASSAPLAWTQFGQKVRDRLQQRLAADDEQTRHAYKLLGAVGPGGAVLAKVWIDPTGAVERIEFDGLNSECALALRAILSRVAIGGNPPADMLQPVRLKLTLPQPVRLKLMLPRGQ